MVKTAKVHGKGKRWLSDYNLFIEREIIGGVDPMRPEHEAYEGTKRKPMGDRHEQAS